MEKTYLSFDALHTRVTHTLAANGFSPAHAAAIARIIVRAEQDQCRSHGLYRLPGLLKTLHTGIADGQAEPQIDNPPDKAILKIRAQGTFSPLAFERGAPLLAAKAKQTGIAALAINDCVHYTALWPEVETLAGLGVAALAMCPSNAYVAPAGGIRKLLGTNPFAFAWPCTGGHPYVFDFATSAAARGEIELHMLDGKPIPADWAIDAQGQPTRDAQAALNGALLPFGGHKGSALATMIELLAGVLIGDLLSIESSALDNGRLLAPRHGELLLAIDPHAFGAAAPEAHTRKLLDAFAAQGARLPSARRYAARARAQSHGIAVSKANLAKLEQLAAGELDLELH